MFLVDTEQGRIIADEELKKKYAGAHPYQQWLDKHHVLLRKPAGSRTQHTEPAHRKILQQQQAFGYTFEDLRFIIGPMAQRRRAAARLDGHGHAAGGALEQAAVALQLFQAAVRAGHEPAD